MNEIVFAAVTPEHERPLQELLLRNADDANWEPEEAEARAGAVAARATAPDAVAMVALDEAAAVGVAMLVPGDHASVRHVAALRLLVDRAYWNRGIGTRLLVAALERAPAHGVRRIEATPYLPLDAWKFHLFIDSGGFEIEGVRRRGARRVDGDYVDVLMLARLL